MLPAFLLGGKRRAAELGGCSTPIEVTDEEAPAGSFPATLRSNPIEAAPLQTIYATPPKKKKKKKKTHERASPNSRVIEGAEKVGPSAVGDSGGSQMARRIDEVRDCDLRFKSYPTAGSIEALSRRINLASSSRALGCIGLPTGTVGETLQLAIDHAAEVVF